MDKERHKIAVYVRYVVGVGRECGIDVYLIYERNRVDMITLFESSPVLRVPGEPAGKSATSRVELKICSAGSEQGRKHVCVIIPWQGQNEVSIYVA